MSLKRAIIYVIIAIVAGVILGGISRIWDIDLDIFPFIIPVVIFIALSGSNAAISKRRKRKTKKVRKSKKRQSF